MRRFLFAALGVLAVAGVASAQQPRYPAAPAQYQPTVSPVITAGGTNVVRGDGGCTNCGPTTSGHRGFTMGAVQSVTGGKCMLSYPCQNGCGSVKSDLAFHFGSCKNFFSNCGPTCGGLFGHCPVQPFNAPFGTGWACPRQYDSYANH
jgi:hypothetical protein